MSAAADIVAAVVEVADEIAKAVIALIKIASDEHKAEEAFTKAWVDKMRNNYPDKNCLIAHAPPHVNPNFSGVLASGHYELALKASGILNQTQGYDWWIFDSGDFTRQGDPGFINWCFAGNFTRGTGSSENHVHFDPIPPSKSSYVRDSRACQ